MTFRSEGLAKVLASLPAIGVCFLVSATFGTLHVGFPQQQSFLGVTFLVTFCVVVIVFANAKPYYLPTRRYPGGKLVAPLAFVLFLCAYISRMAMGGTPDIIGDGGQTYYVALNHGRATPLSPVEFSGF